MLLSLVEFIGRFHPVLVHLPIGILLLALLLQWLSRKEQYTLSHAVMKTIWFCGTATALLSCITGYLLSLSGGYDTGIMALHMWMGIGVAAVSLFISAKVFNLQFDLLYKLASLILVILIFATGHLGGTLTHGSDYLSSAFSEDTATAAMPVKVIANIQEAQVYGDVVQPLLQSRCQGCHGPRKQKGGLRMDGPQWLMKGGKDGPVLIPGNAEKSELIKRLLLAREEEHHMPPKDKPQLSEAQVALLHWWIEEGADFNKKVRDLSQPDKIKPVLVSLQGRPEKKETLIPTQPVAAADEKLLEPLKEKGVMVMPVARNSNYLMVSFLAVPKVEDADIRLLLPLKKQLLWLKLSGAAITDSALRMIGQCTNISVLQLNGTGITDKGLPYLKSLDSLQSLNLVGTRITASGLLSLQSLKKLASLYVYQTLVDRKDFAVLQKTFPKTMLDTGGYKVPYLVTDTTLVTTKK